MHLDKLIKKRLNMFLSSIDKHKRMNMKLDQQKFKESLELRWKEDFYGLTKEMIKK